MTPEKLKRHLRLMAEQGMRAVCPHPWPKCFRSRTMPSCMEPDYLTPEYFAMLKVIADECRRLGMYCYLYDEGGWPSGYAAGRVRLSDPENFAPYFIDKNLQVKRIPLPPEGEVPVSDLLNRQARIRALDAAEFNRRIRGYFTDPAGVKLTVVPLEKN